MEYQKSVEGTRHKMTLCLRQSESSDISLKSLIFDATEFRGKIRSLLNRFSIESLILAQDERWRRG